MLIRTEAPADILVVDQLLKETFETEAEANLVMSLRENGKLTLALVACTDEGEVVGHILFSPVTLEGSDIGWQGLAPLAVKADYRRQGIAQQLVEEGLVSLAEFGYPACVVLGEPNYYRRFGFESAAAHQFRCQWPVPDSAFMIKSVIDDELTGKQGLIEYSTEFTNF